MITYLSAVAFGFVIGAVFTTVGFLADENKKGPARATNTDKATEKIYHL